MVYPAASRDAIEAADNRDGDALLELADEIKILIGADVVVVEVGEVGEGLGKGFGAVAEEMVQRMAFVGNLFLKKRVHHHCADASIFQAADGIYLFG